MKDVLTGRVDLVRAFAAGGTELQDALARLLGMERLPPEPTLPAVAEGPATTPAPAPIAEPPVPVVDAIACPFWAAQSFAVLEPHVPLVPATVVVETIDAEAEPPPDRIGPTFGPLAPATTILTALRRASAFSRAGAEPDVPRIIEDLSRGRFPGTVPRRPRKTWGRSILVVIDRHGHLAPYWDDQGDVVRALGRLYPRDDFHVAVLSEGESEPHSCWPRQETAFRFPDPGTTVLALSDLGCLARDGDGLRGLWLDLGRRYRENGNRPLALVPCDAGLVPAAPSRVWTIIPWENPIAAGPHALSPAQAEEIVRRILTLLSYALRVEPRLIRAVRRLLVKGRLGAGLEALLWQDEAFQGRHHQAAEFRADAARQLREEFERERPDLRRAVLELIRRCHCGPYPEVWHLERLGLEAEAARVGLGDGDLIDAIRWVSGRRDTLREDFETPDPRSEESLFFRRAFVRLPGTALEGSAADALHEIWALTNSPEDRPPVSLDPARLPAREQPVRTIELRQHADRLVAWPVPAGSSQGQTRRPGSPIGLIRTRYSVIRIETLDDFWDGGVPPGWASGWGRDALGAWVAFRVGEATQRLRWIPPGRFLMGSPKDESERFSDEDPRHEESIEPGFWMFDTPCTQALWQEVMGENPSQFQGGDRPVERVSWEDCRAFLQRLNERLAGLGLALPSEAQWEYACRAGTETPRYREDLDEIAWYWANSQEQTQPVARKAPNGWGLYDMLGNVWEWCSDTWRPDYTHRSKEGTAATASTLRVIRGGSWNNDPQNVRAAYRHPIEPLHRDDDLGFRCAEFRASGPAASSQDAERAGSGSSPGAEHRRGDDREPASKAAGLRPGERAEESDSVTISTLTPIRARTDLETLTIRPVTLPRWASAIGRDRYGLWAEFTIDPAPPTPKKSRGLGKILRRRPRAPDPAPASAAARQRLRWIPPGRFLMGSPKDEKGRWDWEGPRHPARIDSGFWMFDTPCPQGLWAAVMGANPSHFQGADRPVERVSWEDCQAFLRRLNERLDGLDLALPSEAQWEYACRAGTETPRYREGLDEIAWFQANSQGQTQPVARKAPNDWGLYDMLGNVWEWCADAWRPDYTHRTEEGAAASASAPRVIRGGSWDVVPRYVRAAFRDRLVPTSRYGGLGFRCAEFRSGS